MKAWRKYKTTYVLSLQSAMEYRTDFLLSLISGGFIVAVQCFLWTAVFRSSSDTVIQGYTYSQMIVYSVLSGVVSKLVSAGFEGEIANDIKTGGLSKFIAQPISYFAYRLCSFFGGKTVQTGVILLILGVTLFWAAGMWGMEIGFVRILLFLVSVLLGLCINFLLFYAISSMAFAVTEVWGIFIAFNQGVYLLSGAIFPLDIFGETAYKAFSYLPFPYIVFFPVNVINGHLPVHSIGNGLAVQAIWIIALAIMAKLCWTAGMRKYVAVGG